MCNCDPTLTGLFFREPTASTAVATEHGIHLRHLDGMITDATPHGVKMLLLDAATNLDKAKRLCGEGRYDDGAQLNQQTYKKVCSVLGEESTMAYKVLQFIGCDLMYVGDYNEAIAATEDAMSGLQRLVGASSPHTTACVSQLAVIKELAVSVITQHIDTNIGERPEDTIIGEEVDRVLATAIEEDVADLKQLAGPVHPATLAATRKLALQYLRIESLKAWNICAGLLKLTTLSLGVDHLETKATLDIVDSVVLIINSADYETSTLKPGKTKERDAAAWTSLKEVPASTLKKLCCGNTDCPWRTLPLNLGQPKKQPTWQCMQCKLVFYCDRDCQKTHWKDQGHKAECTPAW